ncbi:MAG: gfo/Idh/MocA family oxidoreductase [Paenibacillus sp.]|nr:gfo/Idh/MocA family oxidoreductase [Paenibacillus sp.]
MKIKTLLAGCGSMGGRWMEYALARPDVEMVGLVDVYVPNAEATNARHGLALPIYSTVEEAMAASGADLLLDTSIPECHASNAVTAMLSGAHVMMEKPMATSMPEAKRLIEVSERTGRFCAVMQNRRFTKEIRSLKRDLDAGIIGKPGFVKADFFLGPRFGGFRETMDHPLLLDMAIHTFDAARYLIGSEPVAVYAAEFNPDGSWYAGNASAACVFEFGNGAVFAYNGSWSAVGHSTSWEGDWRITGTIGSALWNGDDYASYQTLIEDVDSGALAPPMQGGRHWQGAERREACLNEMFEALISGKRSETDIRDNIHSVAMMLGAIESAALQSKVMLPR